MTTAEFAYEVTGRREQFRGPMFSIVTDDVTMPDGVTVHRDYMRHVGAVGVVALDESDRIVLVRQYRHPVGLHLWELPAGLIDVPGEPLQHAAARELAEEADLVAGSWQLITDIHTSPGCSNETIRLFLARDLSPVADDDRHQREHEEAELTAHRVPLDEAVAMVLRGEISNAACVVGVLSAARLRDLGWPSTRPLDTPRPIAPEH
jgi:ADP-ribose pyrophosphatase